jgi:hypothetical protein
MLFIDDDPSAGWIRQRVLMCIEIGDNLRLFHCIGMGLGLRRAMSEKAQYQQD